MYKVKLIYETVRPENVINEFIKDKQIIDIRPFGRYNSYFIIIYVDGDDNE